MNKDRRKRLETMAEQISSLIDKAQSICDEEQEAFDNGQIPTKVRKVPQEFA